MELSENNSIKQKKKKEPKYSSWSFTVQNWNDDDIKKIQEIECDYLTYGKEVAPTTGQHHLQGFIYWKNKKAFSTVKKKLPEGAHLEKSRASAITNIKYCQKDGDFFEKGTKPPGQGHRTDLDNVVSSIKSGKTLREVADENPVEYIKYPQGIQKLHYILNLPKSLTRQFYRVSIWISGNAGTGKSTMARRLLAGLDATDVFQFSCSKSGFIDGYTGQHGAIFDDFRSTDISPNQLLKLADPKFDCPVDVKGGTSLWVVDFLIVTSIKDLKTDYFNHIEDIDQFTRRFVEVHLNTDHSNFNEVFERLHNSLVKKEIKENF